MAIRSLMWLALSACARPPHWNPPDEVAGTVSIASDGLEAVIGDAVACDAPAATASWSEVGELWGLEGAADLGADHLDGGPLVVADLDGDGVLELVYGFLGERPRRQRLDGSGGPGDVLIDDPTVWQLNAADLDGDGDLDLAAAGESASVWWQGDDGEWDVQIVAGPGGDLGAGEPRELLPADLDGDGAIDLAIGLTYSGDDPTQMRDRVAWGDGLGGFELGVDVLPADVAGRKAFDLTVFDWQADGDLDVYVVNDLGLDAGGNALFARASDGFYDAGESCLCDVVIDGMGASVADYNGDGLADLFLAASASSRLLQGQADGSFVDVTAVAHADPLSGGASMAWGSAWADLDNDGAPDLVVAQGDLWAAGHDLPQFDAPLTVLRQTADGFEDASAWLSEGGQGSFRAVGAVELNGDGVLDIVATDVVARPRVYLSDGCVDAGWLSVSAPARSEVRVTLTDGSTRIVWADSDPGFAASVPPVAWFGLGVGGEVSRVQVRSPDGRSVELSGAIGTRRAIQAW